jgi:hypothetical protein
MKTGIVLCVFLILAGKLVKAEEEKADKVDDDKTKTLFKKMIARRREVSGIQSI